MKAMRLAFICGTLTCTTIAFAFEQVQAFDSRGTVDQWSFHNGPEFPGASGAIRWNEREGRAGPGCLELQYSFAKGGNYVAATGRTRFHML